MCEEQSSIGEQLPCMFIMLFLASLISPLTFGVCVYLCLDDFFEKEKKEIFSYCFCLFRTDWLYSQKYDRDNPSIHRSKTSSMSRSTTDNENESTA